MQYYTDFLAVSPDGNLIYIPIGNCDFIAVLDANVIVNGQDPLITNIGAFVDPYQMTVSPMTQFNRNREARAVASSGTDRSPDPSEGARPGMQEMPVMSERPSPSRDANGQAAANLQ